MVPREKRKAEKEWWPAATGIIQALSAVCISARLIPSNLLLLVFAFPFLPQPPESKQKDATDQ